jgi:hypothetical protein
MDDPLVNGLVVFGTGRMLNGVLIRRDPSTRSFPSPSAFVDAIWPTIEHLNTIVPNHSRIIRQMIIVADVGKKPFLQSDKGTIKTKDTLLLYKDEIDAAYEALEAESDVEAVKDVETPEQIEDYVKEVIRNIAKRPIGDDDDFFESGKYSALKTLRAMYVYPLFFFQA